MGSCFISLLYFRITFGHSLLQCSGVNKLNIILVKTMGQIPLLQGQPRGISDIVTARRTGLQILIAEPLKCTLIDKCGDEPKSLQPFQLLHKA